MATIDFVRHAEPDITIHDDFLRPLTSAGQRQTQQLVDSLHQYPYTAFFSSPLKRAVDTITPIADDHGYPFKKTNYWWSEKCLHGCQIFLTMLISSGKI